MRRFLYAAFLLGSLGMATVPASSITQQEKSLSRASFKEIVERYTFVDDFVPKDSERPVSQELFWRYPLKLEKIALELYPDFDDIKLEFPSTKGSGRAVQHLNQGRVHFLAGEYEAAKNTWLGAKARYGKDYPYHRRTDYFIGYAFLKLAIQMKRDMNTTWADPKVRGLLANASTFFNWAFVVKRDIADEVVDYATPKGFYNLAVVYMYYERYGAAYGAAESGVNFLRKTGRNDFRPQLKRIVAEAFIRNHDYLAAIQELDAAIRQDPNPTQAAAAFARVGDIYFDLNNYELAEDAYALSGRIDEEFEHINPEQLIMRGESLFWLGEFSEAQKVLHFALEGQNLRKLRKPLSPEVAAYGALRWADAYLARNDLQRAKAAYHRVFTEFRGSLPARIADIRRACLELPFYQGNNVQHARDLLDQVKAKSGELPSQAVELAWACHVGSYADRDRTPSMVERVRQFASRYPESRFLKSLAEPVRAVQSKQIDGFFAQNDPYDALSFFEKNRKTLFPKIDESLEQKLFVAYMDTFRPEAAAEFWAAYQKVPDTDSKHIRNALFYAEMADKASPKNKAATKWVKLNRDFAARLSKRSWQEWKLAPTENMERYLHRLLATKTGGIHSPWVYNVAYFWSQADEKYLCSVSYPVLSRWQEAKGSSPAMQKQLKEKLASVVKDHFPKLLAANESCASSILDLESKVFEKDVTTLAGFYLQRKEWLGAGPQGALLQLFWHVAETASATGHRETSRELYKIIQEKAPPESPESKFAKSRLDPKKTEFESMW